LSERFTHAFPHALCPGAHEHAPLEQVWVAEQALLQAPQFALSTFTSTQTPPHRDPTHAPEAMQAPLWQNWPGPQAVPHAPQLAGSTSVSAQALPHLTVPLPQVTEHAPFEHASP
jgi:hypothetical protein